MREVYVVSDLEQVRLLGDPLKLEILQCAVSPRTIKDIAAAMGQNVTKLYRHVDALRAAGLLEVIDERQKRGTVERTFRAVAKRFETDPALFRRDGAGDNPALDSLTQLLRNANHEIVDAVANLDEERPPVVMRLRFCATQEQHAELAAMLRAWIKKVQNEGATEGEREFGALVALYPIEKRGA